MHRFDDVTSGAGLGGKGLVGGPATAFDYDGDGLLDGIEDKIGTDPLDEDSDDDGVLDGADAFPLDASVWEEGAGGISGYELPGSVSVLESEE